MTKESGRLPLAKETGPQTVENVTAASVSPAADSPPYLEFRHVDTHPNRQVVSAVAGHADGKWWAVGHLPGEGWFCLCPRGKRCDRLAAVAELVPTIGGA